ncbi:hypothetical protein C8R48DRAFT_768706 [Suillus tomentosus]|nr:hypothetical protein C8R48DRAFT_768706 [Suillus tomentosus]
MSEAGRIIATEPLASESEATETGDKRGGAVLSDRLPITGDTNLPADQNSLATIDDRIHSQQCLILAQSDNNLNDTDRTDKIHSETNEMDTDPRGSGRYPQDQPCRQHTFVPASKDDLDTMNTRLGRIETQITDFRTAVESRRSSSCNETPDDIANDADTEETSAPQPFKKTGPVKHRSQWLNRFHELIRDHTRILMK